ncbi:uncharacterized protein LOC143294207 [Babylonia areolata]|uniref:uncharacterized protein LOC143294207 n=1 Tax=Babylonia areolata TaxID=304850 RepID=UPI003FD4CCD9
MSCRQNKPWVVKHNLSSRVSDAPETSSGGEAPAFSLRCVGVCAGTVVCCCANNASRRHNFGTLKIAIIDRELTRLNTDIAALEQTRLPLSGSLREQFFWQGKELQEPRLHGVGFAVRNSLLSSVESPYSGTARILALRLSTSSGPVNLLSIYAPTLCSSAETKDKFYEEPDTTIQDIPATEQLYLLGDFTAQVASDHNSWPSCIGRFGIGKLNENGQRLLQHCCYHNLCITNTFFSTKPHHRTSWRHPRSRHWHQLDLITRRPSLNCVLSTHSFHSADCDTDHSLTGSKVRFQPKRTHHSNQKGWPRVNTARTAILDLCDHFANSIEDVLKDCHAGSAEERWNHLPIEAKRVVFINHKGQPSKETHAALKKARNDTKRTARRCANDYWLNLCQNIQLSADCSNTRSMYDGMKKAFSPCLNKIAPLKSAFGAIITDQSKQVERWAEHYQELYSRENIVADAAMESIPNLSVMEELDIPPSEEELSKAIVSLVCGKAPGKDGIPPEVIKAGKRTALFHHLHQLLLQCWTPTSSLCSGTRVIAATATTTAESPSSVSLGKPLPV